MIKLDKNKPKTIKMDVNVQGIDKTKLNFSFKIKLLEFSISFKPELISENKLQVNLPALSSKLIDIDAGRYKSCLEINDGEKYFLKPWEGEILIEEEPVITANVEESENLLSGDIEMNFIDDEDSMPKANIENVKENKVKSKPKKKKPKKKMSKDEAVEFVQKAKKKFKNENKKVVDQFIKKTLNENGFNYNPEKLKKKKSKNINKENIKTKGDVLNYLKKNGIRSETTLERLMESLDSKTGGDVTSMIDMAERMFNPNHTQFENTNDVYQFFQNSQEMMSSYNQGGMGNNSNFNMTAGTGLDNYEEGEEVENVEVNGISVPASSINHNTNSNDSGYKSNLMEQIQNAKSDLSNQLKK